MSLSTLVTVSTMTTTLTYMICGFCYMLMGVISNIYCKCKYCTFTWTSILAYTLLLICQLSSVSNTMKPLTEKIYDQGKFVQDVTFIHSVFRLTTGPKPPPKRFLHIVRSRASSQKRYMTRGSLFKTWHSFIQYSVWQQVQSLLQNDSST